LNKEFHGLSVDQNDVLQIDGNCTRFLLDYVVKYVQILFCNSAADAQHHDVVTADESIDSAAHFDVADEALVFLLICFLSGTAGVIGSLCIRQAFSHS
jgi:hypothetical protein